MKSPIRIVLPLVLGVGGLAFALPRAEARTDRPRVDPVPGSLHPGVQAGRLQLASPMGGYVDLGAPLRDHEAEPLVTYRAFDDQRRIFSRSTAQEAGDVGASQVAPAAPDRIPGPRTRTDR